MTRGTPAGSSDFLGRMAAASQKRAEDAGRRHPEERLAARIARLPPPPALRLSAQGFDVIAEVKRRSPSAGHLAADALRVGSQARQYRRGGACAFSVLTEPTAFDGHLDHLKEVVAAGEGVPAMRKDFLVAPIQVLEARAAGASGVLLITAMLDDGVLRGLLRCALELGLFALVELFDEADLRRTLPILRAAGPAVAADGRVRYLLGVNCRDLRTLQVDFGRFTALAGLLPADIPRVAESGVESEGLAARVAELGYDVALVGTALMRAADPAALLGGLLEAGRASKAGRRALRVVR